MRRVLGLTIVILCGIGCPAPTTAGEADSPNPLATALRSISGTRMLEDVAYLSGPEFNGRQAGTADDLRSGSWIADRFKSLGLKPALRGHKSLNPVLKEWAAGQLVLVTRIQNSPALELRIGGTTTPARLEAEFLPILDSPTVEVTAPVVFVGYGITDPERGVDDYAGVNVRNRVVLMLRGQPPHYPQPVSQADKERMASAKGAAALLVASGPVPSAYEMRRGLATGLPLASYSLSTEDRRLAGAWISTSLADAIVASKSQGRSLSALQTQLDREPTNLSHETETMARLSWTSWQTPEVFYNIMAAVPGRDPKHREETIVLGAHRDHFGRQGGLVFPGADDNASGTAVLLEVARALSKMQPKRTILLVSFSGEEQGLLGSRLYVREPPRPLSGTKAMINVDHAGVGNGRLTVGLSNLPKETVLKAGKAAGVAEKLDLFGFFPGGDHVPFKEAGVPTVTVVSGGPHPDFHRPSDTADKVRPDVLATVARFVLALTWKLANDP